MIRRTLRTFVTWYLQCLTRLVVWRHRPDVIAVTGITNKTATKRAIRERLAALGLDVREHPRCYNTEIGVPLAVLYLESGGRSPWAWLKILAQGTATALVERHFPKILVLEFGVSGKGDMRVLLRIIQPRVAVFTDVVPSAFNPQTTVDELTSELATLVRALPANGLAVFNIDDPRVRQLTNETKAVVVTFGQHPEAMVHATDVRDAPDGLHWTTDGVSYHLPKFGQHHLYAALAAEAVTRHYQS